MYNKHRHHWNLTSILVLTGQSVAIVTYSLYQHTVPFGIYSITYPLFYNQHLSQVSQRGSVGHSGTNSTPKLMPQVFNGVEVRTAGRPFRPFHPLHSQILVVVSDKPRSVGASVVILEDRVRSQTVEIWDCHWLQNLFSISLCIEIASNDDKPCVTRQRQRRFGTFFLTFFKTVAHAHVSKK